MSAQSDRRLPRGFEEHFEHVRPSWADLGEWIRAWRSVMRDPDKTIPEPGLGPEGDPIPADLDLHCPECGYDLTGLTEWRCPECGEKFSPRRAYTLQMLKQPEYFLRYRYGPEEIRRVLLAMILLAGGMVLVCAGAFFSKSRGTPSGWVSITFGLGTLSAFSCLAAPTLILLHFAVDMPWSKVFFRFALPWFVLCVLLFVGFLF